jgi:hypothetical protein
MNDYFLQASPRLVPDTDWMVGFVVFTAFLYVLSRLLFPRYHNRIANAFFNRYETTKLIEEKTTLFQRAGFLLNFVPVLCIAMVVFQQVSWLREENLYDHPFLRFSAVLGITMLYFALRLLLVYLFGLSFQKQEIALRVNQLWLLQFHNLSRFLLVPTIGLPFMTGITHLIVLIAIWAMLAIWLAYTLYRELELLKYLHISLFYMILYLCTLEILPLWWALHSITEGW